MSARWDIEQVDLAEANALGDAIRACGADASATAGTELAAMCLCMFNLCGVGAMARRRGLDVHEEMRWFMGTFIGTLGELLESRYDHN